MDFCDPYDHDDSHVIYTPENIPISETESQFEEVFASGCSCTLACTVENDCACAVRNSAPAYSEPERSNFKDRESILGGRLLKDVDRTLPIYECNSNCACAGNLCLNRLAQFGPRAGLRVQPANGKGHCLVTAQEIKRGGFVCEYAGEVITAEEAAKRTSRNEVDNRMNYIFCIREQYGANQMVTIVDPSSIGNIGRYINHSCEPNCAIVLVRVDGMVPKICIFAKKDIKTGEEITFHYGDSNSPDGRSVERKPCVCGSDNCAGFLPYYIGSYE